MAAFQRKERVHAGDAHRAGWAIALAVLAVFLGMASAQPAVRIAFLGVAGAVLVLLAAWRAHWVATRRRACDAALAQALGKGEDLDVDLEDGEPRSWLPDLERLDLAAAERLPWSELDWAQLRQRLDAQAEAWRQARQQRVRQRQRQRALGLALSLVEHGLPSEAGAARDAAALRAESLLLQADPGPRVLDEYAALQARRYALAIAAASGPGQVSLQRHGVLLSALRPLLPTALQLREQGWRIRRLAWNPQADLDQVDVASALAADYRQLQREWLLATAGVVLPDGITLETWLLTHCPTLRREGGDDIAQVEASEPLWPAFHRLAEDALAALQDAAERAEAEAQAGRMPGGVPGGAPAQSSLVG